MRLQRHVRMPARHAVVMAQGVLLGVARRSRNEMAGIVTNTGGLIIKRAREFIDKVGLALELDTESICSWCVLPVSFQDNFMLTTLSGKKCS